MRIKVYVPEDEIANMLTGRQFKAYLYNLIYWSSTKEIEITNKWIVKTGVVNVFGISGTYLLLKKPSLWRMLFGKI